MLVARQRSKYQEISVKPVLSSQSTGGSQSVAIAAHSAMRIRSGSVGRRAEILAGIAAVIEAKASQVQQRSADKSIIAKHAEIFRKEKDQYSPAFLIFVNGLLDVVEHVERRDRQWALTHLNLLSRFIFANPMPLWQMIWQHAKVPSLPPYALLERLQWIYQFQFIISTQLPDIGLAVIAPMAGTPVDPGSHAFDHHDTETDARKCPGTIQSVIQVGFQDTQKGTVLRKALVRLTPISDSQLSVPLLMPTKTLGNKAVPVPQAPRGVNNRIAEEESISDEEALRQAAEI